MERMSSILAAFSPKNVTERYCKELRSQSVEGLSKRDKKDLERTIRDFREHDCDKVLGAITVYEIFCPGEGIRYARQKGVFNYGSEWPNIEYCLERLCDMNGVLSLPVQEQRYIRQKLACKWLRQFYVETRKKLSQEIYKHHKKRLQKSIGNVQVESNFMVEMLAYISLVFRYRDNSSADTSKETNRSKNTLSDWSNEEISEAVSFLIYLFIGENGFVTTKILWLDKDYVLSDEIEKLVLLACQRNQMMEWEQLVDCLNYEIKTEGNNVIVYDPSESLEKSLRIGFVKTMLQKQLFAFLDFEKSQIGLFDLAQYLVESIGDQVFEWRSEDKLVERYRMLFPEVLLEPLCPKKDVPLELYREEYMEMDFAAHELTFGHSDLKQYMVTEHCSAVDLILLKRIFLLLNYSQRWLFQKEKDLKKVIPSLNPLMTEETLLNLISKFVGDRQKALECLQLLSWDGNGKLDLQYTPIIKCDLEHYYIASDILISSNIIRNSIVLGRSRGEQYGNSNGIDDPLERFCEASFHEHPSIYKTRANVRFEYQKDAGEIDLLVWSDRRLYVFECKNAILPTGSHEIRATYEHIQKASQQLDFIKKALEDTTFQREHFQQWGIVEGERTLQTCILLGNRLFTVPNGMKHSVRYAYELNMVLTSGIINSTFGHWSCWSGDQFTDDDLVRFLSDSDPISQSMIAALIPYSESFYHRGKRLQFNSFIFNFLQHMKNEDELLRIVDRNEKARQEIIQNMPD